MILCKQRAIRVGAESYSLFDFYDSSERSLFLRYLIGVILYFLWNDWVK